ncbi:MAG: zinc-ribbon domain-containing protein, partial [Actinomycetota bacterium]|nr:zinc-ribbon domain-containing protein [Actinomycetota bacterium]
MNCPSCAASVSDDANFCTFCGANLGGARESSDPGLEGEHLSRSPQPGSAGGATTEAASSGRGDELGLKSCPRCGATNGPRRMVCGRCGANLVSGHVAPSPEALADEPFEVAAPSPVRWKLVAVIVAVSAVVGTVVGALVAMRAGGDKPTVAAPAFDRAAYPEQPGALEVADVSATSTLAPRGSIAYAAELIVDGDPQTAWNEGAEPGRGEGESLRMRLAEPAWVTRLVIRNGYQKDQATF